MRQSEESKAKSTVMEAFFEETETENESTKKGVLFFHLRKLLIITPKSILSVKLLSQ